MNKIPTFEEMEASGEYDDYASCARAYAKLHVKAALEVATKKAKIIKYKDLIKQMHSIPTIDKDSILNAYPLENIQ